MISIYVFTSSHMLINALVFSNVKTGKKSEWSHFQYMNGHSQEKYPDISEAGVACPQYHSLP